MQTSLDTFEYNRCLFINFLAVGKNFWEPVVWIFSTSRHVLLKKIFDMVRLSVFYVTVKLKFAEHWTKKSLKSRFESVSNYTSTRRKEYNLRSDWCQWNSSCFSTVSVFNTKKLSERSDKCLGSLHEGEPFIFDQNGEKSRFKSDSSSEFIFTANCLCQ